MTERGRPARLALSLAALGVVFGDIGTSPLYAMRECFTGASGFPVDRPNVLGVLSLITWSLLLIVAVKYVVVVLRADNQGEGGILALAHLIVPTDIEAWTRLHWGLVAVGLFGAALLFGDGILTPALSVLSAVEGLGVATPVFEPYIVPITVGVLVGLFSVQRFGTGRVGALFGPVMLVWFAVLAALGLEQLVQDPSVLAGLNPMWAVRFFESHGAHGSFILGAVFLVVTGAEAMYADLGHFGRQPIQRAWMVLVLPALLLNYFGQGALLLRQPEVVDALFYHLVPPHLLYPLVILAMCATIIASQAVISGVFSLTSQSVSLHYFPLARLLHTSAEHRGQIFVPSANRFLLIGTVALVVVFQSSGALADAYGIAVSLTMAVTSVLMGFVMTRVWRWPVWLAVLLAALMLAVDLAFFGSILRKVASGGWIPLTIAAFLVLVMAVFRRGRQLLLRHVPSVDLAGLDLPGEGPVAVLVREASQVHNAGKLDRPVLLLHVKQCHQPWIRGKGRGEVTLGTIPAVDLRFGFMELPDVPRALEEVDVGFDLQDAIYVLIEESFVDEDILGMPRWMKRFWDVLRNHAAHVGTIFQIDKDRVVEVKPAIRVGNQPSS